MTTHASPPPDDKGPALFDLLLPATFTQGAGFLLGWYALVWGVVALCPGSTFGTSPLYRFYADYAPENVWGLGFGLAGLIQVVTLWVVTERPAPRVAKKALARDLRWLASVALAAGFAFTAYLFVLASSASPAGYVSVLFAVWQVVYARQVGSAHDG